MIKATNIINLDKSKQNQWAIVRSMKKSSPWIIQVPELSPSVNLFYRYLDIKKAGNWGQKAFKEIYVPQFLREMKESGSGMLNRIYLMDKQGIDITMGCFCPDESLCHRSIIAGLLQGAGCQVITDKNEDYSRYFAMFKAI